MILPVHASPAITVIALCFNHERFVVECLDSIARQTCQDFELIVCDDASTDGSAKVIAQWIGEHRPAATFIRNSTNQGICRVLNAALAVATGAYISIIATDDRWTPEKLACQLSRLEREGPGTAMVYSDAACMDVGGEELPVRFIARHWPDLVPPSGSLYEHLAIRNFIPAMATLIRTDVLRTLGGFDEELAYEDYDMWLRVSLQYAIVFEDAVLAWYRIVPGSLTQQLFSHRNPTTIASNCRIALKMSRQLPDPLRRARWLDALRTDACELYELGDARAGGYLRAACAQSFSPRLALMATLATCGVSLAHARRVARFVRP